jgi:hypothetical protein
MTPATEDIAVEMNAARVCDAIARIGYSPASAIMDLTDNSVTAGATRVAISVELHPDKTYGERANVSSYAIADNGRGMSNDEMLNALRLGSNANYAANSLSKYGMGLKAAGFSLGTRIELISRQGGAFGQLHFVDRAAITTRYVVSRRELTDSEISSANTFLGDGQSGTLVRITGCQEIVHQSAATTVRKLTDELGVVYHDFLRRPKKPLILTLSCTGKPTFKVPPRDILFRDQAVSGFDPDTYDCKTPVLVLKKRLGLCDDDAKNPLLEVVLFPKASLSSYAGFSPEERDAIKSYAISRKNKGFFIYRNDRLIRWGDDLEDKKGNAIVGRDDLLFRARLAITDEHDDILHVDVSKQHLMIPEYVSEQIRGLVQNALSTAKEIAVKCDQLPKDIPEGAPFSERNEELVPEDPDEPVGETPKAEARERRKKLIEETNSAEPAIPSPDVPSDGTDSPPDKVDTLPEAEVMVPVFRRVRYSDSVRSVDLWAAGEDPYEGPFVRINRNHLFYDTVLSQMPEDSPERQAIEGILFTLAAAECKVYVNQTDVEPDVIQKVLRRFRAIIGTTLDTWCSKNQDLFDATGL